MLNVTDASSGPTCHMTWWMQMRSFGSHKWVEETSGLHIRKDFCWAKLLNLMVVAYSNMIMKPWMLKKMRREWLSKMLDCIPQKKSISRELWSQDPQWLVRMSWGLTWLFIFGAESFRTMKLAVLKWRTSDSCWVNVLR